MRAPAERSRDTASIITKVSTIERLARGNSRSETVTKNTVGRQGSKAGGWVGS